VWETRKELPTLRRIGKKGGITKKIKKEGSKIRKGKGK